MFLFRATHGKVLAGSSSFANQTTTAAGRHIVSNPIRSSKRYESTATSATSLNQAHRGHSIQVTGRTTLGRSPILRKVITMAKLIFSAITSLDGYIDRKSTRLNSSHA